MRREFVQCKSLKTAKRRAPWACEYAKVFGGWIAFESVEDYRVWLNQR